MDVNVIVWIIQASVIILHGIGHVQCLYGIIAFITK